VRCNSNPLRNNRDGTDVNRSPNNKGPVRNQRGKRISQKIRIKSGKRKGPRNHGGKVPEEEEPRGSFVEMEE